MHALSTTVTFAVGNHWRHSSEYVPFYTHGYMEVPFSAEWESGKEEGAREILFNIAVIGELSEEMRSGKIPEC